MSKITDELKQRMLKALEATEALEKNMEQVFAGGLRVEAVRIDRYRVVIQLFGSAEKCVEGQNRCCIATCVLP